MATAKKKPIAKKATPKKTAAKKTASKKPAAKAATARTAKPKVFTQLKMPSASGRMDAAGKKQTRKGLGEVLHSKTPTNKTGRESL